MAYHGFTTLEHAGRHSNASDPQQCDRAGPPRSGSNQPRPPRAVPWRWKKNEPLGLAASSHTYCSKAGVATLSPSTAPSTEMAGVITPSPYNDAAPKRPSVINNFLPPDVLPRGRTSATKMPPSPRLSAFEDKADVLERDDKVEGPTAQQSTLSFSPRGWDAVGATEALLKRVQWAGTDAAV